MEDEKETDGGFPSGDWSGFWTQPFSARFHRMTLNLGFSVGRISGDGIDEVGPFRVSGSYDRESRKCWWMKSYASHDVYYRGAQQGRSIAGAWEIDRFTAGANGPIDLASLHDTRVN